MNARSSHSLHPGGHALSLQTAELLEAVEELLDAGCEAPSKKVIFELGEQRSKPEHFLGTSDARNVRQGRARRERGRVLEFILRNPVRSSHRRVRVLLHSKYRRLKPLRRLSNAGESDVVD